MFSFIELLSPRVGQGPPKPTPPGGSLHSRAQFSIQSIQLSSGAKPGAELGS